MDVQQRITIKDVPVDGDVVALKEVPQFASDERFYEYYIDGLRTTN